MSDPIVTMEEARDWLRITEAYDDTTIELLIAAATEAALTVADAYDPTLPPPAVLKLAVLAHVARAYTGREDTPDAPEGNARLLMPYRTLDV